MKALKNVMDKFLRWACIILFIFITCIGTYQIVTRYVFNKPSTVSEELLTYSFTWLALIAATYVFGKRDHMRMEFFVQKFKGKSSVILAIISEFLVMIFAAGVMVYGGIEITKLTVMQITASLGIHMSYVYVIVPICGVLIVIYNIINLSELFSQIKSGQLTEKGGDQA